MVKREKIACGARDLVNMNVRYLTTPIYYVNDRPHVGHAYTTIAADTLARYFRAHGDEVRFVTGTDENSQKTVDAAAKAGEDIKKYTDRLAEEWKSAWKALGISHTDFIRTTEERHKKTVEKIWKRIWDKGDIYKGKYEGLYCTGHEAFLKESDLVDGVCPDHKSKPERVVEENYFFKLSKYEKELTMFYEQNPNFVVPAGRFNEVKSFVRQGLEDISVSREGKTWGIPVPNDPKHVVYVWFDALINYISAVGVDEWQKHPADMHFIGKDIIRFHAIIWPAMLMSAGFALPKQVVVNGFFTIDGVKISKSLGNAIDPLVLKEKYGTDALRYFLLREIPFGEDGDFSEEKFKERYNADLANGLGNFSARVLQMSSQHLNKTIDLPDFNNILNSSSGKLIEQRLNKFEFDQAIFVLWSWIKDLDGLIEKQKTFKVVKENKQLGEKQLNYFLTNLGEIAVLAFPFLPIASEKITNAIFKNEKPESLFPRIP